MKPSASDRLWLATAAAAASLHAVLALAAPHSATGPALKAVAILALVRLAAGARPPAPLLAVALVAHAAGDVLIEIGPFLAAMSAFGVGHLLYVRLFWSGRRPWEDVRGSAKLSLGALALAGALVLQALLPVLPPALAVAVPLYAAALLAAAALAQVVARGRPWVPLGAWLYVVSDVLLELDRFVAPLDGWRWLVWPAYWLGQAAIALGWLRGGRTEG